MKYALKEWNVNIEALGKGKVVAIWRKGGIQDTPNVTVPFESFNAEQNQFVLFPTFTHQNLEKVKEEYWYTNIQDFGPNKDNQIKIKYWAEIEEELTVESLENLLNTSTELVNSIEYLKSSWNLYKEHKGKILLLRVYSLSNPILITNSKEYGGCKSWIELNINIPKIGSKPVLPYKDFSYKTRYIKALLEQPIEINQSPGAIVEAIVGANHDLPLQLR